MTKRILIILLALVIVLVSISPILFEMTEYFDLLYHFKRIASILAFVFMLYQIILTSRLPILEQSFAQDKLLNFHRFLGTAAWLLLFSHGLIHIFGMVVAYGAFQLYLPDELPVLNGIVTLGLLTLLALGAIFRRTLRIKYDTWLVLHRITHLVFLSGFLHSLTLGATVNSSTWYKIFWICLGGIYLLCLAYRLKKYIISKRQSYLLKEKIRQSHNTFSFRLAGPEMDFIPGQFMYVSVQIPGKKRERHPYTISAMPFANELEFTAKAIGDFSRDVQDLEPGTEFQIDGPYGLFSHTKVSLESYLVFIAGGVGITPFMSMLRFLKNHDPQRHVVLLWANKTESDVLFAEELMAIDELMPNLKIVHIFSENSTSNEKLGKAIIKNGYIDRVVFEDVLDKDLSYHYFLCGPAVMQKLVLKELKVIGVKRKNIEFEKFLF